MTQGNVAYVDTSALAKYYVVEDYSVEVKGYLSGLDRILLSDLTITEMRCLLARRKRMKLLGEDLDMVIYNTLLNHIEQGFFTVLGFENRHFKEAANLISMLPNCTLRTLDALHLAVATDYGLNRIATADNGLAEAAGVLGLEVDGFGL